MKPTKSVLEKEILIDGQSYESLGRKYCVTGACIKKWAIGYNITLPKRIKYSGHNIGYKKTCLVDGCEKEIRTKNKKHAKYCSRECHKKHEYDTFVDDWKNGIVDGSTKVGASKTIRRYLHEKLDSKCSCCGISEWMGNPITLEVEHIDGDSKNNTEENLTLLCPNCHSQTPTYKAKNVGNGREYRRERYSQGKSF